MLFLPLLFNAYDHVLRSMPSTVLATISISMEEILEIKAFVFKSIPSFDPEHKRIPGRLKANQVRGHKFHFFMSYEFLDAFSVGRSHTS